MITSFIAVVTSLSLLVVTVSCTVYPTEGWHLSINENKDYDNNHYRKHTVYLSNGWQVNDILKWLLTIGNNSYIIQLS